MTDTDRTLAALLGDVVDSRLQPHRSAVQRTIVEALERVNHLVPAAQPLEVTIGDEFQGAYDTLSDAIRASLLVRLTLLPEIDTRFGIGTGPVTVFNAQRTPVSQDGPAWWAAREAIQHVHRQQQRSGHERAARTWYIEGDASHSEATVREGLGPFVNAHLLCRDTLVPHEDPRGIALLRGWLDGRTQSELAAEMGVTQPAVSQRLARMGAFALRDAQDLLARVDG